MLRASPDKQQSKMKDIYKQKLKDAFAPAQQKTAPSGYLLKGDVSGIQEFIFDIPSDGAARMLKARSFFLQALTKLCIRNITNKLGKNEVLLDSGGSFYLRFDNEPDLEILIKEINEPLIEYGLHIALTSVSLSEGWKNATTNIRKQEEIDKYKKFLNVSSAFNPIEIETSNKEDKTIGIWKQFAKYLADAKYYEIKDAKNDTSKIVLTENSISIWNVQFLLQKGTEKTNMSTAFNSDEPTSFIMKEMPIWREENPYYQALQDENSEPSKWEKEINEQKQTTTYQKPNLGDLIDFDHFEKQAKLRTGTDKIGVLKLDVDNLGSHFRDAFNSYTQFKYASDSLAYFFGSHLHNLWEKNYKDDILIVFAGGDDCFALGAWDRIFEFAYQLHKEFKAFTENKLTFSASLMIVDAGYPVIRIGKEAEALLDKAKHASKDKNAVCMFGEVFSWKDYEKSQKISVVLKDFIENKQESKSILQTIRLSARGYEALLSGVKTRKTINMQKVWNLSWFLLRKVSKDNKADFDAKIVSKYHDAVLDALVNKKYTSALVYPMAARWTELLTRNIKTEKYERQ
jgi:CRISPR-associated protein Csm1